MTPSAKREAVGILTGEHGLPVQRACGAVRLSRAAFYRPPGPRVVRDHPVIDALLALVAANPRWGFWLCDDRRHNQGRPWNHKRVDRVYCALRLNLPRRTRTRVVRPVQHPLAAPARLNHTWAIDFMTERSMTAGAFARATWSTKGIAKRSRSRSASRCPAFA